jgi:hypothetical protein
VLHYSTWKREFPCGCGRRKNYGACHASEEGWPVAHKDQWKNGAVTGYSNPKCFMNVTQDCVREISKEHIVPQAVSKVYGSKRSRRVINNTPQEWINTQPSSKILCRRHNSNLSWIDSAAKVLVQRLLDLEENYHGSIEVGSNGILLDGRHLELFLLKIMRNVWAQGIASYRGVKYDEKWTFPHSEFLDAFFRSKWLPECGLYIRTPHHLRDGAVSYSLIQHTDTQRIIGLTCKVHPLWFDLLLCEANPYIQQKRREGDAHVYRPERVTIRTLVHGREVLSDSYFAWDTAPNGSSLSFTMETA